MVVDSTTKSTMRRRCERKGCGWHLVDDNVLKRRCRRCRPFPHDANYRNLHRATTTSTLRTDVVHEHDDDDDDDERSYDRNNNNDNKIGDADGELEQGSLFV